jgi:hypothetical protein
MRVGPKRHLGLAVRGPCPRALNRDPAAAERHLPSVVAMTNRGPVGVVLALRAHDLVDLLLHQLGQHPEPDTHAEREQPVLGSADKLAQRLLDTWRQLVHRGRGGRDRYVLLHGGSSLDLWRITAHAPNRNGRGGGTAVSKFHELRDNLRSALATTLLADGRPVMQ